MQINKKLCNSIFVKVTYPNTIIFLWKQSRDKLYSFNLIKRIIYYCTTNLREGGEEATSGSRRDLSGVDRGNHECIADADASDKATNHEESIVGGKSHESSPSKEDGLGHHYGVSPAYPVGGSAGGA